MSANSNNQGRAYEYAWMTTLFETLDPLRETGIVCNSSYDANERAWNAISEEKQKLYTISANAAVNTIIELEPMMEENSGDTLLLEFQKDESGESGDVRDIVIRRDDVNWEIGLSIKHNHDAVKHSRLSHVLDFGKEWYGIPCSDQYWDDISPVFDLLKFEQRRRTAWSDLDDKEGDVYVPLLQAFLDEVYRAYNEDPSVTVKMFEYLVGIKDYHKIVSHDNKRMTLIHTFNLHGTLNQPGKVKVSACSYEKGFVDKESLELEQTVIALGDIVFASFPYELFSEIGMRIDKAFKTKSVLSLSNANGSEGYFITQDAICRGGYEVDMFLYGHIQPYCDDADFHLMKETIEHIKNIEQKREQ